MEHFVYKEDLKILESLPIGVVPSPPTADQDDVMGAVVPRPFCQLLIVTC